MHVPQAGNETGWWKMSGKPKIAALVLAPDVDLPVQPSKANASMSSATEIVFSKNLQAGNNYYLVA